MEAVADGMVTRRLIIYALACKLQSHNRHLDGVPCGRLAAAVEPFTNSFEMVQHLHPALCAREEMTQGANGVEQVSPYYAAW